MFGSMVEEEQSTGLADAEYATRVVHNERAKLLANALDRASTACLTVGIATPIASYLYCLGRAGLEPWFLFAACYVWLCAAFGLHWVARRMLERLIG